MAMHIELCGLNIKLSHLSASSDDLPDPVRAKAGQARTVIGYVHM